MSSEEFVLKQKIISLVKMDATMLLERLELHGREGVRHLNLKRSREHFDILFMSKFFTLSPNHLLLLTVELQVCINRFYEIVLELKWYFLLTEELPLGQEDKFDRELRRLKKSYLLLMDYCEASF